MIHDVIYGALAGLALLALDAFVKRDARKMDREGGYGR